MSFNFFDLTLVVIIVAFAFFSYMRGALKELISLLGLAGGYWAATRYHNDLGKMLEPVVRDLSLAELLSFLMILALGYLVGTFAGGFGDFVRSKPPGFLSSIAGAAIGVLKGLVISLALVWLIDVYITAFQDEVAESSSAPYLARLLEVMAQYDPL